MATLASFSDMLNEYLVYDLMWEETKKRNYLLSKVETDTNWKGGTLPVPFEGAAASTFVYGGLAAEDDITEYDYVRGEVAGYKEVWGSMIWNAKDLVEHVPEKAKAKGYINKQSFLRNITGQLTSFIEDFKDVVSVNLLGGNHLCKLTATSNANDGVITVDRIERLKLGQKVIVDDDDSTAQTGWVKSININTDSAVLVTTKGGSTVIDFSAAPMTVAQNAKVYIEGADTSSNVFTSLRAQLLSAANGGSSSLYGQTKLSYPYLQAPNISGASMNKTNILVTIFNAWKRICNLGKGHATDVIMSFKHLGNIMALLELGSGPFRHVETKANPFGYTEIVIQGVKGRLTMVGVQEMDDDVMYFMDWSALKLHSNGWFEKHTDPEGKSYYVKRTTSGYKYIVDIRFYGELVLNAPCRCGVIYGISYADE